MTKHQTRMEMQLAQEWWASGFAQGARGGEPYIAQKHVDLPYRRAYRAGYAAGKAALKQALRDWRGQQ